MLFRKYLYLLSSVNHQPQATHIMQATHKSISNKCEKTCIVCAHRPRTTRFHCGHSCFCSICCVKYLDLQNSNVKQVCPYCRSTILLEHIVNECEVANAPIFTKFRHVDALGGSLHRERLGKTWSMADVIIQAQRCQYPCHVYNESVGSRGRTTTRITNIRPLPKKFVHVRSQSTEPRKLPGKRLAAMQPLPPILPVPTRWFGRSPV